MAPVRPGRDPSPTTVELPGTPTRTLGISTVAQRDASGELLRLDGGVADPVERERRMGGWPPWRAAPPTGGARRPTIAGGGAASIGYERYGRRRPWTDTPGDHDLGSR